MDDSMKHRLQMVLDRVREPETGQSITDLGLVRGINHHSAQRKLVVFLNPVRPGPTCCSIVGGLLLDTTKRDLAHALENEFPGLAVEYQ